MDHLSRPDCPPAQTRPSCALRGAGGRRRWPAARGGPSGRPSSPRAWSLKQPLPRSSASSTCEHRRRTRAGEKVAEADEFGGWRGGSRLWVGYASTIPKEKLERQEIVEYPCGSLSPSLERDRPGGDAARLTPQSRRMWRDHVPDGSLAGGAPLKRARGPPGRPAGAPICVGGAQPVFCLGD